MAMIEREMLVEKQRSLLEQMPHEAIAHGASVPFPIVYRFCPSGLILEPGCGDGTKAHDYENRYGWYGFDINPDAVLAARAQGYIAHVGDARSFFGSEFELSKIALIENFDGVLLQGLLANIVSKEDLLSVFQTIDIAMRPGAHLCIAEPVRYDQVNIDTRLQNVVIAGHTLLTWQKMWRERYERNRAVGLPMGVFAVARPGPHKEELEWTTSESMLRELIEGPELERFARHVSPYSIDMIAERLKLTCYLRQPDIMFSREGKPLYGMIWVYRKEYGLDKKGNKLLYKYHPWYKDHTIEERAEMQDWRHWYEHRLGVEGSMHEFFRRFQNNLPPQQQLPKNFFMEE